MTTFSELFTFSRSTGATRVNEDGLIVGVDFSSTSNTIGTGSKTFVLTATANVNRSWSVGEKVVAVSQAGATGSMTGTVTSYVASTQTLIINVTSITGSGTSTDWRIGSLEFRYDHNPVNLAPRGGLVEGQATNLLVSSQDFANASWTKENQGTYTATITANAGTAPDGSNNATLFSGNSGANGSAGYTSIWQNPSTVAGVPYTSSIWVKAFSASDVGKKVSLLSDNGVGLGETVITLTAEWTKYAAKNNSIAAISGKKCIFIYTSGTNNTLNNEPVNALIWGGQFESGAVATSYIPTTTVAVTRAADLLNIDGTRFSQAYNQSQGTLYVEMTPVAAAVQAVTASLNDGTLNNAIRIGQKQSGTLSSIRAISSDGVTDVMALNASGNNTLRGNGIDMTEVSDGSGLGKFAVATSGVGSFLNGGGTESIFSSADSGLTYTSRTIGGTLSGAHFGIGRFVIAGSTLTANGITSGSVIVSTDGLSFRRVNIPSLTQNLNEITSNGTNQYVAVGNGGVIYTSPDAETWTARTSGQPAGNPIYGVTYSGSRYVTVGAFGSGASVVSYSDDGITWATANPGGSFTGFDVHFAGGLYVAVGQDSNITNGTVRTSPDGITWTLRFTSASANTSLRGVHFADGLWVAVGLSGTVITSPDGITWTDRTATSGTTQILAEVGFFGGKFYYVGLSQVIGENTAAAIVAGTTWTARTANVTSALGGLAASGSRLLVCGSNGAIATSEDGITFTSRTGNTAQLNGAAFGAGTYVVAGNAVNGSGLIATVDPATFAYTRRVSGVTGNLTNVRFLNGLFFYTGPSANSIGNSPDGITWTNRLTGQSFFDIAFGAGTFVAIGNAGTRSVSTDGNAWSNGATGATTQTLTGIDFANGLFVAVGLAGAIITSPNGTTWTVRTSGTTVTLYVVRWNTRDQCFYAAGDSGVILRSDDGITWENISNDAIGAVINGGNIQANPALPNLTPSQKNKVAIRIKPNNFAVAVNGEDPVIDNTTKLPLVNRLSVGMSGGQTLPFNGHIRKMIYYPVALNDQQLKNLTV